MRAIWGRIMADLGVRSLWCTRNREKMIPRGTKRYATFAGSAGQPRIPSMRGEAEPACTGDQGRQRDRHADREMAAEGQADAALAGALDHDQIGNRAEDR